MLNPDDLTPEQLRKYYHDVFVIDKRGAAILENLVRQFSKPPVTDGGIDAVLKTFTNAGEHKVIQHIIRQINLHNNVEEPEQGPDDNS